MRAAVLTSLLLLSTGCGDTGDDLAGSDPPAGGTSSSAPASSPTPTEGQTPEPTPSTTAETVTRALFFGDSYIVGGAYTGPDDSMASLAAARLGWKRRIAGGGGTGFVSGNPDFGLPNFIGQIRAGALDVGPVDWLVIEGGGNDKADDPALIEERAVEVLTEAMRRHPEARVVLVGTMDPTVDDFTDTDSVIGALGSAAAQVGVPYVDAQRWLEGRQDLVGPDFDHPTPAGHQLCGRKLAEALRALS